MNNMNNIYMNSRKYACENGERDSFAESYRLNMRCAEALDNGIRKGFDGCHLNDAFLDKVVQKFGVERVGFVLANNVYIADWDGRYSHTNREWADSIASACLCEKSTRLEWLLHSHPAVIDGVVTNFRKKFA